MGTTCRRPAAVGSTKPRERGGQTAARGVVCVRVRARVLPARTVAARRSESRGPAISQSPCPSGPPSSLSLLSTGAARGRRARYVPISMLLVMSRNRGVNGQPPARGKERPRLQSCCLPSSAAARKKNRVHNVHLHVPPWLPPGAQCQRLRELQAADVRNVRAPWWFAPAAGRSFGQKPKAQTNRARPPPQPSLARVSRAERRGA